MQNRIWEIISARINGELLSSSEEGELQLWLDEDSEHSVVYRKLERYYQAKREEQGIDVDMAYRRFYTSRLEKIGVRRGLLRYVGYAASIVLIVVAGWWIGSVKDDGESVCVENQEIRMGESKAMLILASGDRVALRSGEEITLLEQGGVIRNQGKILSYSTGDSHMSGTESKYNKLDVPRGGEYHLILEDGTRVWLNSESRLTFPVFFGRGERHVLLEGEAYFEVRRDTCRPFVVTSRDLSINVLGTSFNITAYKNTDEVVATLVEGSVRVDHVRDKKIGNVMKPGEQVVWNAASGKLNVREVDVHLYTSWKDGYYMFEQERLEVIMDVLSRWYDGNVFFEDHVARDIRFSGRVKRYEEISEFLETIKLTNEVDFEIKGKTVIVRRKKN